MGRLEISLLGSFDVRLDGKPVTRFETDSARALLAYLALNPGVVFSRDKLASLLWDGPADTALNNLRPTLHRLRKAIEGDESTRFLEVTRYTIKFEAGSDYWLDVEELKGVLSTIQSHNHRRPSACPVCRKHMERAVILYQNGLLAHFDPHCDKFNDWLTIEREQLRRQIVGVLQQLWEYYNLRRQYMWAEEYVRREVDLEPLNEDAHRRLMITLALQGERNAALAQYHHCAAMLKKDFDLEPDVETRRLFEAVKAGVELSVQSGSAIPVHNLPVQLTSFVGRESEKDQLIEWMMDPDNRLVTITGLGGIGKTRLAQEVAQEMEGSFEHGVWWVSLGDIEAEDNPGELKRKSQKGDQSPEIDALVNALTNTLQLPDYTEQDRNRRLFDFLRPREVLLVIDRFEHLVESGREFIISLLHNAPRVYLLVTSRRRLNLQAERFLELSGLPVPDNGHSALEHGNNPDNGYASLRLFAERAGRVRRPFVLDEHNLPGVVEICQLVEGMPLAIELAAARVGRVNPGRVALAIRENLQNLSAELHDLPRRHRNVRSVFEGSWSILSDEERQALAGLAVFHNDFESEAAFEIVGTSEKTINSLADQSLLRISPDGRLQIHELLRQFAQEKLEAHSDATGPRYQFCSYYLGYLADREARLFGEQPQSASAEISNEWDNIHDAWQWAVSYGYLDVLQRGLKSLTRFCNLKGWMAPCKHFTERAIDQLNETLDRKTKKRDQPVPEIQAKSLLSRLYLAQARVDASLGEDAHSETLCRRALAILEDVYDSQAYVEARLLLSELYHRQGDFAAAHEQLDKLLSGTTLLLDQRASIFRAQSWLFLDQGRIQAAEDAVREALVIYTQIGDAVGRSKAISLLGDVSYYSGRIEEALHYNREFMELSTSSGDRLSELSALSSLGKVYLTLGDEETSRDYLERAKELSRALGNRQAEAENLALLGHYWQQHGDIEAAWHSFEEARGIFARLGHLLAEMDTQVWLAQIHIERGDTQLAQEMLNSALEFFSGMDHPMYCGRIYVWLSYLAALEGRLEDGRELAERAFDILEALSTEDIYIPLGVYLACIQALRVLSEEQRANIMLQDAWDLLQARSGRIQDPALRAAYLENVNAHRDLILLYEDRSAGE